MSWSVYVDRECDSDDNSYNETSSSASAPPAARSWVSSGRMREAMALG